MAVLLMLIFKQPLQALSMMVALLLLCCIGVMALALAGHLWFIPDVLIGAICQCQWSCSLLLH